MATTKKSSTSSSFPQADRHRRCCTICAHPQRTDIEDDFIAWESAAKIATAYHLRDRSAVYRHALALGLNSKRDRNLRAALARMIEADVKVTAAAKIQAIALYARLNEQAGIGPDNQSTAETVFSRMSPAELQAYAEQGILPNWITRSSALSDSKDPKDAEIE